MVANALILQLCVTLEIMTHALAPHRTGIRKLCAVLTIASLIPAMVVVVIAGRNLFSLGISILFIYRLFNMARIIKGRMHQRYLWQVTFRTSLWLIAAQGLLAGGWWLWLRYQPSFFAVFICALVVQTAISIIFVVTMQKHIRTMRRAAALEVVHDTDLPSLTVAIPARNETADLHDCITALLSSHYPKLEIIVLDDCSQTRRTPEIIRGFAHDGVRFIHGEEPQNNWLAKNQAYETLAQVANGEWLLFMGVDVRLQPNSLRQLVAYALHKHKTMLSVMPQNEIPAHEIPLIQPMRYMWELALPRHLLNRPPVLSSCWLITKDSLRKAGGFQAAARMVVPEAYFARRAAERDGYSFLTGAEIFGVTSTKGTADQRDTAIRVAYPQTHRKPQVVAAITVGYALWIGLPLTTAAHALITTHLDLAMLVAAVVVGLNVWLYISLLQLAYGKSQLGTVLSLPLAAITYIGLLNYSMYKYEFSEVLWKDRNVCLPVMHVIPHLPDLPEV